MIPELFHYVWIGPYADSQSLCYDWDHITPYKLLCWNNKTAKDYVYESIELFGGIDNLSDKSYTYLSDMVRLLILKDYGGVYLDHDIRLVKDIRPLLDADCVLTFQYSNEENEVLGSFPKGKQLKEFVETVYGTVNKSLATVNNCFIAVTPNHYIINKAIELTLENHFRDSTQQYAMSDWGVGPEVFTNIAKDMGFDTNSCNTQTIDSIKILHKRHLHPVHGNSRFRLGNETYAKEIETALLDNDTYAIHLHEHYGVQMFIEKTSVPISVWYKQL